jgi:type IV pilus assembly protein PilV
MSMMRTSHILRVRRVQRGVSLIEVLVSMVILMIGLLGLVGVMIQSQRAQVESYQRVQALLLAQDIVARMNSNRAVAACYVLPTFVGTGNATVPAAAACTTGTGDQRTRAEQDLTDWRDLLLGSAELTGGGDKVGAILGARGCITTVAGSNLYQVSVAWQGSGTTAAPPGGVTCGQGLYGDDAARRAVSLTVQLKDLS